MHYFESNPNFSNLDFIKQSAIIDALVCKVKNPTWKRTQMSGRWRWKRGLIREWRPKSALVYSLGGKCNYMNINGAKCNYGTTQGRYVKLYLHIIGLSYSIMRPKTHDKPPEKKETLLLKLSNYHPVKLPSTF